MLNGEPIKSQTVRLADIFIYGPFLVYAATSKKLIPSTRIGLITLGIGTTIYNWMNYTKIKRQKDDSRIYP